MARFYCPTELIPGTLLTLPASAGRHVQVLRLQPGDSITLFNGGVSGACGEFEATVEQMGRSDVQVRVGRHHSVVREAARSVHLALGMPANERMDWLLEKASELGVASIQPLMTERSVLRLSGERAQKKLAHWQGVAIAACEQCGGNRIPVVHEVMGFGAWIRQQVLLGEQQRLLLSLRPGLPGLRQTASAGRQGPAVSLLSGPEGGLTDTEECLALDCGFVPVMLGPRVLRAETAALAALASLLV